jgi:hypothetical protein
MLVLGLLLAMGESFGLRGRWNGVFEANGKVTINFTVKFKSMAGLRERGLIRASKKHRLLPDKVQVRQVRPRKTFLILIPNRGQGRFAEIDCNETFENGTIFGSAVSFDGAYDVNLSLSAEDDIEFGVVHRKRKHWANYRLTRRTVTIESGNLRALLVIICIVAVAIMALGVKTGIGRGAKVKED